MAKATKIKLKHTVTRELTHTLAVSLVVPAPFSTSAPCGELFSETAL